MTCRERLAIRDNPFLIGQLTTTANGKQQLFSTSPFPLPRRAHPLQGVLRLQGRPPVGERPHPENPQGLPYAGEPRTPSRKVLPETLLRVDRDPGVNDSTGALDHVHPVRFPQRPAVSPVRAGTRAHPLLALRELLHEAGERVDPLVGGGIVHGDPDSAHRPVPLQPHHAALLRLGDELLLEFRAG